jgi:uncharacterized protein YgiM (DUF1202 family)
MKKNCWLLLAVMVSANLLAQPATNAPAGAPLETPAPAGLVTNAPENAAAPKKKAADTKKKSAKKVKAVKKDPAAELKTVPLVPGPAFVDANNVNLRGQPRLKGEVVGRLTKGQPVVVLQEIVRNDSGSEEPSAWAKIVAPTNTHVWVNTPFIDSANRTVKARKLNLRGGPGENYSILGQLVQGETLSPITTKADWTQIEAPTNAYAFVAAQYLKQESPAAIAATPAANPAATTEPPATPATVAETPAIAAAPTETPATAAPAETPAVTNATEVATDLANTPAVDEPPPKRIVQREGVVRGTVSIQAPTAFELYSPESGRPIDYLYTSSPNLDLRRYKGLRIIVTGEEGLEERWGNTPVITIQKIQVLE